MPELFWNLDSVADVSDHRALIMGQVAFGTVVSDVLQSVGVRPQAIFGYSLGETAGLFALQFGSRFGRSPYSYSMGSSVPSEFYWSRLQYTSGYANGSSFGFRAYGGSWSRDFPKADNDCLIRISSETPCETSSPRSWSRPA